MSPRKWLGCGEGGELRYVRSALNLARTAAAVLEEGEQAYMVLSLTLIITAEGMYGVQSKDPSSRSLAATTCLEAMRGSRR